MKITALSRWSWNELAQLIFLKVSTTKAWWALVNAPPESRGRRAGYFRCGAAARFGSDPLTLRTFGCGCTATTSGAAGDCDQRDERIEVACWDIIGKAVGQPVWRLLGGQCHEKIKAYANAWYTVERTPQEFAKRVKVVLDKGYKALKLTRLAQAPWNFPARRRSARRFGGGDPRGGGRGGNLCGNARALQRRHGH